MADVKISALPAASALTGAEVLPVVQSGTTDKATVTQVATYVRSVTTKSDVGLGNADNTSDATKNAAAVTLTNKTLTSPVINTPTGIVKADVGLGNVDNTSDATKNSAVATLTNKTLTAPVVNSPTGIVKADVGLGNVDNTSNATERAATATLTNKTLTAPVINSPTGITASDVGAAPVGATYIVQTASAGLSAEQALGALASGVVHNTTTTGVLSVSAVNLPTEVTGLLPDANLSANVPLLNASNTYIGVPTWSSTEPRQKLNETDAATDEKLWDWDIQAKTLTLRTRTDADGAGVNLLSFVRGTGTALASMAFGNATNNPTYSFLGSGNVGSGGQFTSTATGGGTTSAFYVNAAAPSYSWRISGAGVDAKVWDLLGGSTTTFTLRTVNDVGNSSRNQIQWTRSGLGVTGVVFGNTTDNGTTTFLGSGNVTAGGQLIVILAGKGLSIAEGSNAKMGVATLVGGTVVVSTTAVTANSRIFLTQQSLGTVAVPSGYGVSARTAGTSFTILASAPTDTSVIAWMIVEPS